MMKSAKFPLYSHSKYKLFNTNVFRYFTRPKYMFCPEIFGVTNLIIVQILIISLERQNFHRFHVISPLGSMRLINLAI